MAKKKDRAFFVCPRWNEVAPEGAAIDAKTLTDAKTLAAIKAGRPVARSTLRRALIAVRRATGSMFDVDSYVVDQRSA